MMMEKNGSAVLNVRLSRHFPAADVIVSTGGGVICDPKNMEHLRRNSTVVLLFADLDTIEKRLITKPRPPLTSLTLHEEIACNDGSPQEKLLCFC